MTSKPPRYESATWDDVPENIRNYVEKMRETRKGIYIHGSVGTGKTHIVYGIVEHLQEIPLKSWFLNTTELFADMKKDFDRQPYDKKRWDDRMMEYRGVLVFDDIGAERPTDYVLEQFYLIINKRYNEMLPIIFTSNHSLGELSEKVGDRIASRIVEMCDVVHLGGDDKRILKAKSTKNNG